MIGNVLILVHTYEIEPILLLRAGLIEFDLPIPKGPKQPFIANVAHPVKCQFGLALLNQHWFDLNVVGLGCSAEVVDQACSL